MELKRRLFSKIIRRRSHYWDHILQSTLKLSILLLLVFVVTLVFNAVAFLSIHESPESLDVSHPSSSLLFDAKRKTTLHDSNFVVHGAIVFLAPQRNAVGWNMSRFCFLLRAVRSVDTHLNSFYGPYPIHIIVAKDYSKDPKGIDASYTAQDRALVESWAPHSAIHWEEMNIYSEDALEPNVTVKQILDWRMGKKGGVVGRDLGYTSMCRLWSGRVQSMTFLDPYEYYMRMDDDSLLTNNLEFDPFLQMQQKNLTYVFQRFANDHWGIHKLWTVAQPYIDDPNRMDRFVRRGQYTGLHPYNNFHMTRLSFWRSKRWRNLVSEMDSNHLFHKFRVGDAAVHAMALMTMEQNQSQRWGDFPYAHNSNDMGPLWGDPKWKQECQQAFDQWGVATSLE